MTADQSRLAAALEGRYAIERELGAGGMATVYLARDIKHQRQVAVKVLRPELSAVIGGERFLNEIRVTAGLRHPHILPLYDSGEANGFLYYVMPLVEGESLRDRLDREKQLPVEDALRIVRETADALSYAHAHGVIHRDIKPDNVLLESGHAVVADFGIAKAVSAAGGTQLTGTGFAIGTPAYMSPEQAAGERDLDGRSDLYALGCLLYEMLAGQPPFMGPTAESVVRQHMAVVAPAVTNLRPAVPVAVAALLARALAKNPADRFANAGQLIAALDQAVTPPAAPAASMPAGRGRTLALGAAALAVVVLVATTMWGPSRSAATSSGPPAVTLRQVTFSGDVEEYPALSPDGSRMVFSRDLGGQRQLFLMNLGDGTESRLTQGDFDNIQAAWLPDGNAILFVRANKPRTRLEPGDVFGVFNGGDIWRRDMATGAEEMLVPDGFYPAASPDGRRIAFDAQRAGSRRLWVADDRGRNAQQVSLDSSEAVGHILPRWSPDGRKLVFQYIEHTRFDIRVLDVTTRATASVTDDGFLDVNPVWAADGHSIYFSSYRAGGVNVWRVPVSNSGAPAGPPQQITTGAGQDVQLSVPAAGDRLAFTVLQLNADLWRVPVDPATGRPRGAAEAVVTTTREDSRGSWSPDGQSVAFNSDRAGDMNIWIHSLVDGRDRQVTRGPGGDYQPRWSADGRQLVFFSARGGNADIWVVDAAGGDPRQLTTSPWLDINPVFSPDGRMIAFQSDRQGRNEVWLMNADGSEQRQATHVGASGHFELWDADSRSLVFHPAAMPAARLTLATGAVDSLGVRGGSHMSSGPGGGLIADVVGHRQLWVSPRNAAPYTTFAFDDPDVRIDYPVWSPDGRWNLFDRSKPQGGDVWLLTVTGRR